MAVHMHKNVALVHPRMARQGEVLTASSEVQGPITITKTVKKARYLGVFDRNMMPIFVSVVFADRFFL